MRYFLELDFDGTAYQGWQSQPNGETVQETIERAMQILLSSPIALTGCGRTDAGVHASGYYAHFDLEASIPDQFLYRLNSLLPNDIAIHNVIPVHSEAHARFDAILRRYRYTITIGKQPLLRHHAWQYPFSGTPDIKLLNKAANLLTKYDEFTPFCKTNTDALTRICNLQESFWIASEDERVLHYWVTSDRFLRGMIRLIVGMCLRVAAGKTSLDEVAYALDHQAPLHGSWMIPPQGLMLTGVKYPYL